MHRVEGVRLHAPNLRCMRLSRPGYYFLATDTPGVMRWLVPWLSGADSPYMSLYTDILRRPWLLPAALTRILFTT